jgi:hypothetical protein
VPPLGLLATPPAAAPPAAAAFWRHVTQQDTTAVARHIADSVVIKSPLPDPLVPIVQWIFQKPGWLQATGLVLGTLVALAILAIAWRRRRAIGHWLATRDRAIKLVLGGGLAVILALIAGTGFKTYHFMMHDNHFCQGCHIFVPSGRVMARPDTGTYLMVNALEGKHDTLSCHSCHPFALKTQTLELIAWMTNRPDKVPPHGKVPRKICEQCHIKGEAKKYWQRIATTAGHRVHLDSDSLKGKIECLTCHARTAHRFQPVDSTCAQQGCHLVDSVKIRLGRMAARFRDWKPQPNEELLYCNSCHQFTAAAQFLSPDSALGLLRPTSRNCFKCHAMRVLLATFDPAREPHGGACGMCHNPHTNIKPADALKSCTTAQCHANWRDVDFHTGVTHRKVAEQCEICHDPHSARVDASDCVGCHRAVRYGPRSHLRPPLPFDTTAALRQTSLVDPAVGQPPWRPVRFREPPPGESRLREPRGGFLVLLAAQWQRAAPPRGEPPESRTDISASPNDTFPHKRHSRLPCLTCHDLRSKERKLTFEPPRGCQICHHQRPAQADCRKCHEQEQLAATLPMQVAVAVPQHERRRRTVQFQHVWHDTLACTTCHVTPVTLEPADSVLTCSACHAQHHSQTKNCAACHRTAAITKPHEPPVQPHLACEECHTPATVARLMPTRAFCLVCHKPQRDHYKPKECSVCHFQRSPTELQQALGRGGTRS